MKESKKIYLFDLFILAISVFSLLNVILLAIGYFSPLLSLSITVIVLVICIFVFRIKINIKDKRFGLLFLIIIVLALALRISPNLYLTGGQDQGTYVSLSKQYEINHGLYIKDGLRESLSENLKEIYDKGNVFLGLKFKEKETSEYTMPFYPVFPSWMATFGSVIGSDSRIYALTLFSILSIIGVYLLAYEISGKNKKVGLLASFLIAINPLHLYFSRVPLTEVVSLAFICFAFYYLIKFYNEYLKNKKNFLFLILSLFSFTALFYTRMSGLFFLPIIILIPLLILLFNKDIKLFKYFSWYGIFWLVSLLLSYEFYKVFIPDLYRQIIGKRLFNLVNTDILIFLGISLCIALIAVFFIMRIRDRLSIIFRFFYKYFYIIALLLFFGLIFYELYFYIKDTFVNNSNVFLSNESLSLLKQQSFLVGFLYLSPFGFAMLPISLIYFRRKTDVKIVLLVITILTFLIYYWGVSRITQYHYYFARYQLSELIPFCIILVSIFLVEICKNKIGRILSIILVSLMAIYLGYFSILQLSNGEGAQKEHFIEMERVVGEKGLLLVAKDDFASFNQIVFPIKYYYGVNIFPLSSLSYIDNLEVREGLKKYDTVYLLTTMGSISRKDLKLVKEIDFKHNYFVHCNRIEDAYFEMEGHSEDIPFCKYIIIPNRYYYGTYKMYLYEWE